MALGRPTAPLFAGWRWCCAAFELTVFPFNDFYYYIVVCLLLAIPGNPRWRHDVLLLQTAWIYAATALLKVNADWLSGGHLFVRAGYLWNAGGWPHIGAFRACSESLACTAVLARGAVAGELLLAALLFARRGRPLAIALAVGIHLFAALMLNVWFFGASMVAQVALLFPTRPDGSGAPVELRISPPPMRAGRAVLLVAVDVQDQPFRPGWQVPAGTRSGSAVTRAAQHVALLVGHRPDGDPQEADDVAGAG